MSYKGKVGIVTGAGGGIGFGIAQHLVKNGAKVVIADWNVNNGENAAKKLNEGSDKPCAAFFQTDVSSWKSQVDLMAFTSKAFGGRIDYVFANAGIAQMSQMKSSDPTHFGCAKIDDLSTLADNPPTLRVIEVNLHGVLYSLYAALAYFRKQDKDEGGWRGKFVATGSIASLYPFPNDPLYGAAKHGVLGVVRSVGARVVSEGITVNAFAPSIVRTGLAPPEWLDRLEKEGRLTPMKTLTDCADLFLDPKSKISGQIVENWGENNTFRSFKWLNDIERQNSDEFWSADEIDSALSMSGTGLMVD